MRKGLGRNGEGGVRTDMDDGSEEDHKMVSSVLSSAPFSYVGSWS